MSEQKYYVKLIQTGLYGSEERYQLYLWEHGGKYSYSPKVYEEEHQVYLERFQFTKSELAEIMDGALYKEGDNPDDLQPWAKGEEEYINPLIRLVRVEDGE